MPSVFIIQTVAVIFHLAKGTVLRLEGSSKKAKAFSFSVSAKSFNSALGLFLGSDKLNYYRPIGLVYSSYVIARAYKLQTPAIMLCVPTKIQVSGL